ncbi:MAG TPA: metallophosphoesterase [Solirubrobacterales bacterium]|nr:metallophosphoesterase [Solirubrobacterales bacterium]
MRTAIVSDLHLGAGTGEDLARDPAIRDVLLAEVASADRLVLLGDVLELRDFPLPRVLEATRSFFEELGRAMSGRRIVLVPGNHDHWLAEPLLEEVALGDGTLGLEHRALPASMPLSRIASWLGDAELSVAYPGAWLRDDVYATHGHYMDCHMTLPRLECVAAAAVMRRAGRPPEQATAGDYERILRPIYGLAFGLAEGGLGNGANRPSERAWHAVSGRRNGGRIATAAHKAAIGAGLPAGVWLLNRLLRTSFDPDVSAAAITRDGIAAATEMARRLRLDAAHTITGHTHRAGPEDGDAEWLVPGGGRLHNAGSWVYADAFHHPGAPPGPYWPGTVTWLGDDGPPRRTRLLLDFSREELRAAVARTAATATRR